MGSAKLPTRLLPACPKPSAYFSLYSLSHVQLLQSHGLWPARLLCPWDSSGKNIGVGCRFLLQGIFRPRNQTRVSCIAGRFFTDCAEESPPASGCVTHPRTRLIHFQDPKWVPLPGLPTTQPQFTSLRNPRVLLSLFPGLSTSTKQPQPHKQHSSVGPNIGNSI